METNLDERMMQDGKKGKTHPVLGEEGVQKALESTAKTVEGVAGTDFEVSDGVPPRIRAERRAKNN